MSAQINWQQIFTELKCDIQAAIQPCLKTLKKPQPTLGIGAGGDAMKPVDLAAESAIVETLQRHSVSFTLVSEESGVKKFGVSPEECFVTTDPIDGTTNLIHGLPFYASSIAVSTKPEIASVYAAMVVDLHHDISYMAFEGKGAYRDGKRIETSETASLDEAVVGLDLNTYKVQTIASKLTALIEKTKHIRHFGANALELCYVADGKTDAFIDLRGKLRATDVAAGFLVVKEAGGTVTTQKNQLVNAILDPKQTVSFVASANSEIHKKIVSLVKP
ncbi:MAG: D-fructose 1,6-bisphosphatase [Candidatus Bathyarchaeota archaeon]|nr:D-fructose 1,6-bisphosphatase [Candidatus Bathyarchaeota archaeon]